MIVAFCLYKYFPFGGLQRDFMRIAQTVAARGHHVRVYTQSWEGECPDVFELIKVPGLSSTVVGTLAGQVVMQGFIRFHIPLWVRRTVTMLPSFIVILMGLDPTRILVMSQVLLSFGIALALVPLLIFTSDSKLMGDLVNSKRVKQTGWVIVVLVVALNIWLLVGTALGL